MLIGSHTLDVDSGNEQIYNALDCCLTFEVFNELKKQLPSAEPTYAFERALQAPVLEMMLRGFRVNPEAREEALKEARAELQLLEKNIEDLASAILNCELPKHRVTGRLTLPSSGPQLKTLFYNYLGIEPVKTWVKGEMKFQMNREVLEKIEDYFQARPIVACILAYRDLDKQIQVLETEVDNDWRMRTSYNIGGTKTGRFSSSKSTTGSGGNLQNITEDLRYIFIPDPGYILCGIDAEQSDSRMVGFMCGLLFDDWTYLDACESGDLHTYVARLTWPEKKWTNDLKKDREIAEENFYRHHSHRDMCKRLGHGANFLGKAPNLSKETHVPISVVSFFLERYFGGFPAILKLQAWHASEIQRSKQLTSIFGRTRDFFDRVDADETIRKALAFTAASATADNLNLGMLRIWKNMPQVQLLAQVHDAVYFQFPETLDANEIIKEAQRNLTVTLFAPNGRKFSVPTEAKIGYNWGKHTPGNPEKGILEKNPNGLKKFKVK